MDHMKSFRAANEDADQAEWAPYKAACDRDGKEVIDACMRGGTMEHRRMRKLPINADVPYPMDQEVRYIREITTKTQSAHRGGQID